MLRRRSGSRLQMLPGFLQGPQLLQQGRPALREWQRQLLFAFLQGPSLLRLLCLPGLPRGISNAQVPHRPHKVMRATAAGTSLLHRTLARVGPGGVQVALARVGLGGVPVALARVGPGGVPVELARVGPGAVPVELARVGPGAVPVELAVALLHCRVPASGLPHAGNLAPEQARERGVLLEDLLSGAGQLVRMLLCCHLCAMQPAVPLARADLAKPQGIQRSLGLYL